MRIRVLVSVGLATLFAGGGAMPPVVAEEEPPPLVTRVNAAIDRGVAWLRQRQRPDGSWGSTRAEGAKTYAGKDDGYVFPAGPTAFALYTLLKCEVPPDDAGVQKGFEFLRKFDRADLSSYELAAMILAIEAKYDQVKREQKREAAEGLKAEPGKRPDLRVKPSKDDAAWLQKLLPALADRFNDGGWRYFRPTGDKSFGAKQDTSATAIAMLAILAAHRCGADVPRKVLTSAVQWTIAQQDEEGPLAKDAKPADGEGVKWVPPPDARVRGWAYVRKSPFEGEPKETTGNMTTAGLITLLAVEHVLADTSPDTLKGLQRAIDRSAADGIAWLGANWRIDRNPGGPHYHYMYLYGLERVGDLRRVALIAGHDWYTEGATLLVGDQRNDGAWVKTDTHAPADVLNTCFALLFLDRASLAVTTPK